MGFIRNSWLQIGPETNKLISSAKQLNLLMLLRETDEGFNTITAKYSTLAISHCDHFQNHYTIINESYSKL